MISKGPLWKSNIDRNIYVNISNNYPKVEKFKLIEEEDLFKESERLIYVALTRGKYKLIVFNDLEDTNNFLNNDLLNNLEDLNIYKSNFEVRIYKEKIKEIFSKFQTKRLNNNLWKIDNFNKKISNVFNSDQFISYSSYSSWISKDKNIDAVINQYRDYEDNISIIKDSNFKNSNNYPNYFSCLLYTSPSPRDRSLSRMPSSA